MKIYIPRHRQYLSQYAWIIDLVSGTVMYVIYCITFSRFTMEIP